ncbi:putative sugar transporter [Bipolaris maydis]|nr:general substrate transporter [Bipolaris maydis]KAJ6193962.1 putative sugar transporter [Bipolaris maydis]KAJ6277789.1 general substrate transporter [Bipolaris maydis]KAJ6283623.1 general substrate transporter [Bipolaris maydis]
MAGIKLQGPRLHLLVAAVGALAFLLQGYDQAVINGLLSLRTWEKTFPQINTTNNKSIERSLVQGTAVAIYEVGCALGALSCFFIGDILGRRKTIFGASCFVLVGVTIQASSFSLGQLIAARIITGLGVGAFTATVPMWVTECSNAHSRGKMVMLEGMFAIGGVALAVWLDFGFFFLKNNSANWRFPIAFQAVFALGVASLIFMLPESPRWYIKNENYEAALKSLSRLNGLPEDSTLLQQEVEVIRDSITQEHVGASSNPFARTPNRHLNRTLIAICINMLAQMTGVNIITFYSNEIFQQILGYSGTTSRVISGCLQIWQFCMAALAVLLIDRLGRRKLLLIGAAGMAISQAGQAALTKYSHTSKSIAGATLLFDFSALAFFPIGLFLIPFMYSAEIAPLRIRHKITAMSAATNWLFNFLIAEVTPVGFRKIGWKYYLCYMCTSTLCFVFVYFFCPETKNRGLEDIDEFFLRSDNALQVVRIARELPPDAGMSSVIESKVDKAEHVEEARRRSIPSTN